MPWISNGLEHRIRETYVVSHGTDQLLSRLSTEPKIPRDQCPANVAKLRESLAIR